MRGENSLALYTRGSMNEKDDIKRSISLGTKYEGTSQTLLCKNKTTLQEQTQPISLSLCDDKIDLKKTLKGFEEKKTDSLT